MIDEAAGEPGRRDVPDRYRGAGEHAYGQAAAAVEPEDDHLLKGDRAAGDVEDCSQAVKYIPRPWVTVKEGQSRQGERI
jgi:hypothetical protein